MAWVDTARHRASFSLASMGWLMWRSPWQSSLHGRR